MSLLEELLRKAEKKAERVDIPPQLERIVERKSKRRYVISFIILFSFFSGIVLLFIVKQQGLHLLQGKPDSELREQKIEVAIEGLQKGSQEPPPSGSASTQKQEIVDERDSKVEAPVLAMAQTHNPKIKAQKTKKQRLGKEQKYDRTVALHVSELPPVSAVELPSQPGPELSDRSLERRELLYRANFHEARGEYEKAIEYYERILKFYPSDHRVLNQIAYLYVKLGIPEKAIEFARKLMDIKADYIPGMINHSVALIMKGEYKEAEGILKKILTIEPHNKTALYNLAVVLEKEERYEEAEESYRRLSLTGDPRGMEGLRRMELKKSLIEKDKEKERKD